MASLMEDLVKSEVPPSELIPTNTGKNANRLKRSKSKKRVAFASESSLEDHMSFTRVSLRVSRLAELWHPSPHNHDIWLLPDEEISKDSLVLSVWAYGHNGWLDFRSSIPEDVQMDNPLSNVQKRDFVPAHLDKRVSLKTWQGLLSELDVLLLRCMQEQPDFEMEEGGCCCFFNTSERTKRMHLAAQRDDFDSKLESIILKYNAILLGIDPEGLISVEQSYNEEHLTTGNNLEISGSGMDVEKVLSPRTAACVEFGQKEMPISLKHMVAHYNRVGYIALFYYWIEIDVSKLPKTMKMV